MRHTRFHPIKLAWITAVVAGLMVQQFLRSKPETIPAMSSPAWRNGWCRAKRGAIRSSTAENSACHRSGSTL